MLRFPLRSPVLSNIRYLSVWRPYLLLLGCVMLAELFEVERAGPVGAVGEAGGEVGDEEAEGWREVERFVDFGFGVAEGDVATATNLTAA